MTTGHSGNVIATALKHADIRPEAPALTCNGVRVDWQDLRRRVLSIAGAIVSAGGTSGGRVAILAQNSVDSVALYLGAIAAGRCAVPLATSSNGAALHGMLRNCEPEFLFLDKAGRDALAGLPDLPMVGIGFGEAAVTPLDRFAGNAQALDAPVAVAEDAPFNIIYSSGTTGDPKGIVHSHGMRFRQSARSIFEIGPDSVMLLATPLYSNTTLLPLLAALFHGGHTVLMGKFDAEGYLDLAEQFRATHTMLVPIQYQRLLAAASFASRTLDSFKVKQCTSAPLATSIKRAVVEKWPGRFLEVYGLTEGGCTCILDVGAHPDKLGTVGRPAPGHDIRIIGEDGNELPAGERGEIIGRSGTMMTGYFRNETANAAFVWTNRDGLTFHRSGDIGAFDADGFLTLLDRKKDMIISGGFNIYASDLENELLAHPAVAEAAVIAIPSETWGETPLGFVVLKKDVVETADNLLGWVNARVGKTQRLSGLEIRQALPRSTIGKVLKQDLRAPYWMKGASS